MNISFKGSLIIVDKNSTNYCIVNPNDVSISGNKRNCTREETGCSTAFDVFVKGKDKPIMNVQKPSDPEEPGKKINNVDIEALAQAIDKAKNTDEDVLFTIK